MIIDGREIGPHMSPYIISEISCNHNGSLDKALRLIRAAKAAGADAVKFQAYTPDTITIDCDNPDFIVKDGPWKGRKLYELYSKAHTPFEWFPKLFKCAADTGITIFSSVFDKTSVDMLEALDCPAYKIASMEITDIPLIEYAAKTRKPLIISTGMASDEEILDASFAADMGLAFLACTSAYPAKPSETNLDRLKYLQTYNLASGVSDHTLGSDIPVAATALGASIIEKHLMFGGEYTEDFEFSMTPIEFAQMTCAVRNIWQAMQPPKTDIEQASRQMRRSLYVVKDIQAGEAFTEENIRSIRPAYGLTPKELPWVLTKRAAVDLKRGTALKADHIS